MVSFSLGEELEAIEEMVQRFAMEALRPKLRDFEVARGLPDSLEATYHGLGLAGLTLPESLEGLAMGMRELAVVQEALAWGDIGAAVALPGLEVASFFIRALGTEAQQAEFLHGEKMARRGCVALLEPPPAFQLQDTWTFAEATDEGYALFGTKAFALNADNAELYVVIAQTDPGTGLEGLRAFVLEAGIDGLTAGEPERLLGLETARFGQLELSGCTVPAAHCLEGNGDFVGNLGKALERWRVLNAARIVGACRAAADHAFRYSTEREAFGKALCDHQAMAFLMADMATWVDTCRWLVWKAAWAIDVETPTAGRAVAIAFSRCAELAQRVTSAAVQVLGGHGYIKDHPVEKWMRDTRALAIIGGFESFLSHDIADAELDAPVDHPGSAGGVA